MDYRVFSAKSSRLVPYEEPVAEAVRPELVPFFFLQLKKVDKLYIYNDGRSAIA